jgi:hypothetical protein
MWRAFGLSTMAGCMAVQSVMCQRAFCDNRAAREQSWEERSEARLRFRPVPARSPSAPSHGNPPTDLRERGVSRGAVMPSKAQYALQLGDGVHVVSALTRFDGPLIALRDGG